LDDFVDLMGYLKLALLRETTHGLNNMRLQILKIWLQIVTNWKNKVTIILENVLYSGRLTSYTSFLAQFGKKLYKYIGNDY
jgi:hypothetical protein